ncbi:MAG: metal-dependent transcriptional regulator [Flavobacteriales bacterium]
MKTSTEENYLKAIFAIATEKGDVNVTEISQRLELSMPTVTSMMKRLGEQGYINYKSYKPITLTAKGKKEAGLILRKHRLTEMFLVEKMGFTWDNVHPIAEEIEHVRSEDFFDRMDEMLGFPKMDPHGSPIPDRQGVITWQQYTKLTECKKEEVVTLAAVTQSSEDFLRFLTAKELSLGLQLTIISVEPFDKMITVSYGKRKAESFSSMVADKLLVTK